MINPVPNFSKLLLRIATEDIAACVYARPGVFTRNHLTVNEEGEFEEARVGDGPRQVGAVKEGDLIGKQEWIEKVKKVCE